MPTREEIMDVLGVRREEHVDLILRCIQSSEGRGKLMDSLVRPTRGSLDFTKTKYAAGKRTPRAILSNTSRWLRQMEWLLALMDGSEVFDRTMYGNLRSDLRMFGAEMEQKISEAKEARQKLDKRQF